MSKGRLVNIALAVLVIVASFSAYNILQLNAAATRPNTNQPKITSQYTVDKGTVLVTVAAIGNVVPARQSNLNFQTSGTVTAIKVQAGQQVQAGQVLATVDDSAQQAALKQAQLNLAAAQSALDKLLQPIDPNTLAEAQAQVKSAEGSYQSKAASGPTQADLQVYQDKVNQAVADANYAKQIAAAAGGQYKPGDPNITLAQAQAGQADFNVVLAQLNMQQASKGGSLLSAQASIALAQAKLAQTEAGPTQATINTAQANVVTAQVALQQAQHALDKTVLKAPYAGVISVINAKVGQAAPQGSSSSSSTSSTTTTSTGSASTTAAIVITDLSHLYADINVDESDITQIVPGQKLTLTVDAVPSLTVNGTVERIYPIANSSASVITYPVHALLDTSSPQVAQALRTGMTVNATFDVKEVDNVLRIPNNYIKVNTATGQTTVTMVAPGGQATFSVPVKLGVAGSDYTEVLQGLSAGNVIAITSTSTSTGGTGGGGGGFGGGGGGFGGPPGGGG